MTAPAASVAAVQKALGCEERMLDKHDVCMAHLGEDCMLVDWTDRGCPVAVAAADAAVEAATPGIQAGALREAAHEMDDTDDPDAIHMLNGDADLWLRARADRIEAQP